MNSELNFFHYIYILKDKHQSLNLALQEPRRTQVTVWGSRNVSSLETTATACRPGADPGPEEERRALGHVFRRNFTKRHNKHFTKVKTETNIQQKNRKYSDPF